jgi:hypothetical protein
MWENVEKTSLILKDMLAHLLLNIVKADAAKQWGSFSLKMDTMVSLI